MTNTITEHDIEVFIDKYFRGRNEELKTIIKSIKKQEILSWAKIIMSSEFRKIFPTEKEIKTKLSDKEIKIFEELFIMIPLNYIYWRDCIKYEQLFPAPDQKANPCGWAYAIATSIHLTMRRIIGFTAPSFEEIHKDILDAFGNKKASVADILHRILKLPKYKLLHFEEIPEQKMNPFDPIRSYHTYLCNFYLTGAQWTNFTNFFGDQNNKEKILTREELSKSQPKKNEDDGQHAVIAIDADSYSITYMNSWDKNWANEGKFAVERGAISNMKYYDIFWFYQNLSQVEKACYEVRTKKAIEAFYRIFDDVTSLSEIEGKNEFVKKILIEFCEDYWRSGQQTAFRSLDENSTLKNEISILIKEKENSNQNHVNDQNSNQNRVNDQNSNQNHVNDQNSNQNNVNDQNSNQNHVNDQNSNQNHVNDQNSNQNNVNDQNSNQNHVNDQNSNQNNNVNDQNSNKNNVNDQNSKKNYSVNEVKFLDQETMDRIEKIDEIGFGGGGRVFKVAMKTFYAMKEMIVKGNDVKRFREFIKEYELLNFFNHPNIINTYGLFLSGSEKPPSILLEFCPSNLQKIIENGNVSNVELSKYVYQIAEGFRYVHFCDVIHRDVKPPNILIASDGTIKISDFGISRLMSIEEQSMTGGVGTQKFMAPEIINEEDYYNEKVDVYSFGVVLYFMLSKGQMPKIKVGEILAGKKAEIPDSFNEFAKNLIYDCWNFNPSERPSFKEIVERLRSNGYEIVNLTEFEKKTVEEFVTKHQNLIPSYDEQK